MGNGLRGQGLPSGVFDNNGFDHIGSIFTFVRDDLHYLVDVAFFDDLFGIGFGLEKPLDGLVEDIICLVLDAVDADQSVSDGPHVAHIAKFFNGAADLVGALFDKIGHFLDAEVVWVYFVEIYLFRCRVDIVADIVECARQVVDVFTVEWGDEIPAQLGKDAMGKIVVYVFLRFQLQDECPAFIEILFANYCL